MERKFDKNALKEKSLKDLEAAIAELKKVIDPDSYSYDAVLHLAGRMADLNDSDKLYEMLRNTLKMEGKGDKSVEGRVLEFYSMEKNRIRISFLHLINDIAQIELEKSNSDEWKDLFN